MEHHGHNLSRTSWSGLRPVPEGSHHRLSGLLGQSARGWILDTGDGLVWVLAAEGVPDTLLGQRVTVEAIQSGFDRLEVLWIGRQNDRPGKC